jgi:hypothetical protein
LLNKLKVIALLLSVSLLSGCNGITGSGDSEVSMQSNASPTNTANVPTTNTTSVPTAKSENSSPVAGDVVRVARWSKDPNGPSMTARMVGTLATVNNCLVMNNKGSRPTLLIFPYHSGVWDDAKQTFTFESKVIGIGERIEVGGGTILDIDSFLKRTGKKYDVPDCGITDFFVVG